MTETPTELLDLNEWMHAHHLHGYWTQQGGGPGAQRKPHLWRWADIYAGLLQAAALLPIDSAGVRDARTIELRDPDRGRIPQAVSLSAQILMPGERTDVRRSPTSEALFVVQASPGALVVVADGEAMPVESGDLLVIPAGVPHFQRNGAEEPSVWVSAQDAELVRFMGADTGEMGSAGPSQPVVDKPEGYFAATRIRMRAAGDPASSRRPPVRYPWVETFETLSALAKGEVREDSNGAHLQFTSPLDGGATLPTFSCEVQLLAPGTMTHTHRHNSTAIFVVVRGSGFTDVAGEPITWTEGDIFSVPPWSWHWHQTSGAADAVLYSIDDWPTMTRMGFYRMEVGE